MPAAIEYDGPKALAACHEAIRKLSPAWKEWVLKAIGSMPESEMAAFAVLQQKADEIEKENATALSGETQIREAIAKAETVRELQRVAGRMIVKYETTLGTVLYGELKAEYQAREDELKKKAAPVSP